MSLIRKPHELKTTACIKILLYGQPGIGKTTFGLSAPSPLLIDFDRGAHRVRPEHLTETVQVENWQDIISLLEKEDLRPFKTLVIDTAGKMLDFMAAYIIANEPKMGRKDGQLTLPGFGARKGMFQRFLSQVGMLGKHLVFVAHEKEEKDGDQKIIRPEIGGSSSGDLIKELDLVGYMEAKGKIRTISFDPCEKFYGKNTCNLEPLINLPDLNKEPNRLLFSVFDKFAQGLESRNKMAAEYMTVLADIKAKADLIKDAESATEFITYAQSVSHIWDSSLQAKALIRDKAKELGLTLDKATMTYKSETKVTEEAANVAA